MSSKVVSVPIIGNILIQKTPKARRIKIIIKPGHLPKVVIPFLVSYESGLRFALEKQDWIQVHQQKMAQKVVRITLNTEFKTRFSTIKINRIKGTKPTKTIRESEIWLNLPETMLLDDDNTQQFIRQFYTTCLRAEANEYLPKRLNQLAVQHGFSFNKVVVKNLTTRWGSCSGTNTINLNLHLMRLPEHLSDFILLHELCHTVHKNHGPMFHALLDKITGYNEKVLNKALRNYTIHF